MIDIAFPASERQQVRELPALPTEDREAQLLWTLRYRIARSTIRQLFVSADRKSVV